MPIKSDWRTKRVQAYYDGCYFLSNASEGNAYMHIENFKAKVVVLCGWSTYRTSWYYRLLCKFEIISRQKVNKNPFRIVPKLTVTYTQVINLVLCDKNKNKTNMPSGARSLVSNKYLRLVLLIYVLVKFCTY